MILNSFLLTKLKRNNTLRLIRKKQITLKYSFNDLKAVLRYGFKAPRCQERIWIDPYSCIKILHEEAAHNLTGMNPRHASAMVVHSWPESSLRPLVQEKKIQFCLDHWINGTPWEKTGIYEYMKVQIRENGGRKDGLRTHKDIVKRYKNLDLIFQQITKDGAFRTQEELSEFPFREEGGILIHIGPGGEPVFGDAGFHRFTIGLILNIPIPAVIGCVHYESLHLLPKLREKKYPAKTTKAERLKKLHKYLNQAKLTNKGNSDPNHKYVI